jgi:hypothetical protein
MRTSPQIESAVKALLEFHADEIARDPEAAFHAKNLRYALAEGFLDGQEDSEIVRQGQLCAMHLAFEAVLEDALARE